MNQNKPDAKPDMDQLTNDVELDSDQYQWEPAKPLGIAERTPCKKAINPV